MFTGIVTDVGTVIATEQREDLRVRVRCTYDLATVDLGASICCSGVCLTVVDKGADWFAADLSTETLSRTAPDLWNEGSRLNLERPLRVGDELGGHIVTGHIDCIGKVAEVGPEAGSTRIGISVPADLAPLVAAKGSIALDGVSLTVNDLARGSNGATCFTVNVIPHTASHTTLGEVKVGRQLNVEADLLARYLDRMLTARSQ